jgi:hypothetical protein
MKHFQTKILLFHSFAYLFINIFFFISIKIVNNFLCQNIIRSGDGNMGLFLAFIIIFIQFFLGLIISFISSFERQNIRIGKTLTFFFTNLLILLFFIMCNINNSYLEFTYAILGVFILGNYSYNFLLRKYFQIIK